MREVIGNMIQHRDLIVSFVRRDIKARYKQTALGVAWSLIQPLSMMIVFTLVFSIFARVPSDGIPYPVFAYSALIFWTFFSNTVSLGTVAMVSNGVLIRKIYFPRETLLVSVILSGLLDLAVASFLFIGMLLYDKLALTLTALWVFPLLPLPITLAFGVTSLASAAHVNFRDVGHGLPLLLQLWMFATPVAYPIGVIPDWLRPFYLLNPMAAIIDGYRRAILLGVAPEVPALALSAAVTIVLTYVALAVFKRADRTFADVIGAGFHPDLTSRENIFLNGSIMGMTRREVQRKFDQIVAFSEVERFIDTPIKHYSSGMQMRLGFAVAAHTDPDVLLIDEILAVGDASFQAKCLNKLTELKAQDKTIVLVSHNMTNITEQCKTVLWIDGGTVRMIGDPDSVVDAYLEHVAADMSAEESHHDAPFGRADSPLSILDVSIADDGERPQSGFDREDTVAIEIAYAASRAVPGVVFGVSIHDLHGHDLGGVLTDPDVITVTSPVERGVLRLTLSPLLFNKGRYTIAVHVFDPGTKRYYDLRRRAARLTVNGRHAGP